MNICEYSIFLAKKVDEKLNLIYARQVLLLKALNKHRFKIDAFRALGVSEKQGYNLIKFHEVQFNKRKGYYSDKVIEFIDAPVCMRIDSID